MGVAGRLNALPSFGFFPKEEPSETPCSPFSFVMSPGGKESMHFYKVCVILAIRLIVPVLSPQSEGTGGKSFNPFGMKSFI